MWLAPCINSLCRGLNVELYIDMAMVDNQFDVYLLFLFINIHIWNILVWKRHYWNFISTLSLAQQNERERQKKNFVEDGILQIDEQIRFWRNKYYGCLYHIRVVSLLLVIFFSLLKQISCSSTISRFYYILWFWTTNKKKNNEWIQSRIN